MADRATNAVDPQPASGAPADPGRSALLTDLYQLTMLDSYWQSGMEHQAVFELFTRRLPPSRRFLLAAGLEQALDFLETVAVTDDELAWLETTGRFDRAFLDRLGKLRFTGDVWAMPEGTAFFAQEPVLRIEAPLPEAQLVESRLINLIHFQTLICSKAARCVLAASGKTLVDFGMRRAHGAEAAMFAARAAWIAGFSGTATVLAGRRFGLPLFGTMAHSYVQAHDSEAEAFERYAAARPRGLVLLIDTYDVDRAIESVVRLTEEDSGQSVRVEAVRLDSGDLLAGARHIRQRLDALGRPGIGVFLSGDLDEYRLAEMIAAGVPATGFGVGTRLDTSADAPSIDFAYKLQSYAGRPRRKRSAGKATWPGARQVWRSLDDDGRLARDILGPAGEDAPGSPLLTRVMAGGRRVGPGETLDDCRRRAARELAQLPGDLRSLGRARESWEPEISPELEALARATDEAFGY